MTPTTIDRTTLHAPKGFTISGKKELCRLVHKDAAGYCCLCHKQTFVPSEEYTHEPHEQAILREAAPKQYVNVCGACAEAITVEREALHRESLGKPPKVDKPPKPPAPHKPFVPEPIRWKPPTTAYRNACERKKIYNSWRHAQFDADALAQSTGEKFNVYCCMFCDCFHVGHVRA